ncbi:MAG: hypothetical protein LUI06_06755 [Ruminococcus sp.]|nr:hypothetical protein [Ruminococcus sp.]
MFIPPFLNIKSLIPKHRDKAKISFACSASKSETTTHIAKEAVTSQTLNAGIRSCLLGIHRLAKPLASELQLAQAIKMLSADGTFSLYGFVANLLSWSMRLYRLIHL